VPEQHTEAGEETDLALEIAHLLFIDVVGYSKLLVNEQIELMHQLNRIVRGTECFREAEASGKLIRLPTGDGMVLLFFRSPEQPVRCGLQISQALHEYPQIQLRMGVHSGPVNQVVDVNDQINVAGAGINIGQRIMDCGDAGHILLSKHVADDLAQYRHWQPHLHDLGECEGKHGTRLHVVNLHKGDLGNAAVPAKLTRSQRWARGPVSVRPIRVPRWLKIVGIVALLVAAGALAISSLVLLRRESKLLPSNTLGPAPEKSIAVLPFENRSEEKTNAYFADGVQDEVLTRLSKIADLKVISRTSTEHYKSAPANLSEIAAQLHVGYVVEGSVQKIGDQVRVNVQLIKADTDSHIWAETFDRELTSIFAVETEIAKTIAEQLSVHLNGREQQIIAVEPTRKSEAYDAYLRGLAFTLKSATTPANILGAQKWLREAIRLDSDFAVAWALLSYTDSLSYLSLSLQSTETVKEEARKAAETALALQPKLGEALLAKGFYYYACLKDYDHAVRCFEEAREAMPNSSRIPQSLAYVARRRGQWTASEEYFDQAEKNDPRNVKLLTQRALSYIELRRFSDARKKLNQILKIAPGDLDTIVLLATVAQEEGELTQAATLLAPLRPGADDSSALETQVYQSILERTPQEMINRLGSILEKPHAGLEYNIGELRFWLGWAEYVAGDTEAAKASWIQARDELQPFLGAQQGNYVLLQDLAFICMGLGEKDEAFAFVARAARAVSVENDAIDGLIPVEVLARVAAGTGEPERALAALEKLMSAPYDGALAFGAPLTPAILRLDPMFDPLRSEPRFQKLASSPTSVTELR
jgi:TolB-like protein/class 3 adenylate cyclase/Tfp pilus assembly protein PilF